MNTTKTQRTILTIVAVAFGLYLIFIATSQAMFTLKVALREVMERLIPYDPDFYPAVPILGVTFGLWILMMAFGGVALLVMARKIYNGDYGSRALGLGVSAIGAVAGMTMFIPWMVLVVSDYSNGPVPGVLPPPADVDTTPPVMMILFLSLLVYYIFLLLDKSSLKEKIYKFIIYTAIGVVAGMVYMNAQHGVRYFTFIPEYVKDPSVANYTNPLGNPYTNLDYFDAMALTTISEKQIEELQPDQAVDIALKEVDENGNHLTKEVVVYHSTPKYNPNTLALFLGGYGNYIAAYLMVFMIPFVFLRKKWAYSILLISTLYSVIATFWVYFIRHSFEWFTGGILSVILLILLLLPVFKQYLTETETASTDQ